MMSRTTVQAGEKFQSLQEERIHTYRNLNNAHKEYLNTAPNYDFKSYQEEVAKATNKFNDLSTQIITLQKQIENNGASELSEYIKQVQDLEQSKLRLAVQHQLAKQKEQEEENDQFDFEAPSKRLQRNINDVIEEINDILEEIRYLLADLRDDY